MRRFCDIETRRVPRESISPTSSLLSTVIFLHYVSLVDVFMLSGTTSTADIRLVDARSMWAVAPFDLPDLSNDMAYYIIRTI